MAIARREFLKTSSAAAAAVLSRTFGASAAEAQRPAGVPIGQAQYRTGRDYPIQPLRFSDVRLTDAFWKPKVDLNAAVTIPFEVHKFVDGEREFGGNMLEAAIMSLKTHPDPTLQAQVDAQIRSTAQSAGRGNSGFEVAATYFNVTGNRELIDRAIKAADALYEDFKTPQPAVLRRRARRDQLRPALSRHARPEASRSREALPRHPRARELGEPQPAQPVVQARARAARGRRSRGERRDADGVAGRRRRAHRSQGVLRRGRAHVGRRGRAQDVHHRRRRHDRQRRLRRAVRRCRTSPRTRRRARC